MGCGHSKVSAPSHCHRTNIGGPTHWSQPLIPATEFVLPCSNPWITPINRAIIAIPKCNAGDLRVQLDPTIIDSQLQKHRNDQIDPNEPEFQVVHMGQDRLDESQKPVLHYQRQEPERSVEETISNKSINLRFRPIDDNHLEQPLKNADLDVIRGDFYTEADTIQNRTAGALMVLDQDRSQEDRQSLVDDVTRSTEQREANFHPGQTVVDSQTFVSRDQNGIAHLFNVYTIRHPSCSHDPLQGELHIQIMHKTPVHEGCTSAQPPVTSNGVIPSSAVPTTLLAGSALVSPTMSTCEIPIQNMPNHITNRTREFSLHTNELVQPNTIYFSELGKSEKKGTNSERTTQQSSMHPEEYPCSPRYIVMGRATRPRSRLYSCTSRAPTEHKKSQSEPRRCCRLQCAKSSCSQAGTSSSCTRKREPDESMITMQPKIDRNSFHSPNLTLTTQSNKTTLPSSDEMIKEPLIKATTHVPAAKCCHSRVNNYTHNYRKSGTINIPPDYNQQTTNSSAHSELFYVQTAKSQTNSEGILLEHKSTTNIDSIDAGCMRLFPETLGSEFCFTYHPLYGTVLSPILESSRYLIKFAEPGRHLEKQAQIMPRIHSFFASEVSEAAPNETIEEWIAQAPVQYLSIPHTETVTNHERMREMKKSLKRAILDRIAGLRHHDVALQSSQSTASVQNTTGVTACLVEETKFHKCDQPELPKFELARHLEQCQQHLTGSRNEHDNNTPSKVNYALSMTDSVSDTQKFGPEESTLIQPLFEIQLIEENNLQVVETSTDQLKSDKLSVPELKTKPSLPLTERGSSTTVVRKPLPNKTQPIPNELASSSGCVGPQTDEASTSRRAFKEGPMKKRTTAPSFLPPIQTSATVTASNLSSSGVQPQNTACRGLKDNKREQNKATLSLPKLKSDRSGSSDQPMPKNMHNTGKGRNHPFSNQRKSPYDILVVHPPKK